MYPSRSDLREYVVWLQGVPWQLFCTLTFAWPVSDAQAAQVFKAFMNRLQRSFRSPIAYLRGDERRFSGCGKPAAPRHFHALFAAAVRLDAAFIENAWMRMAGFRTDGAGAKVCAYDPKGNAIAYCLKFIFQPGGDWDSRNLDLYLLSPAAEMNRRIRRRMSRQAQRMLEASQSAPLPVCDKSAADTLAHLRRLPIESRTPEVDLDPTCGVDQEATACEIDLAREAGSAGTTNALPRRVSSDEEKVRDCERVSYGESFPQLRPLSGRGEEINMKLGEKMPLHASAQRKEQENLAEQAIELDRQIKAAVKVARRSLTDVGRLLARMKESRLWEHLPGHYRGWEDYVRSVLGSGAHSSLYETVAAFSLTEGSNPIPPEVVNRLGIKKSRATCETPTRRSDARHYLRGYYPDGHGCTQSRAG